MHSEGVAVPREMTVELTVERRRGLGVNCDGAEQVLQRTNEQRGRADRCERVQQGLFPRVWRRQTRDLRAKNREDRFGPSKTSLLNSLTRGTFLSPRRPCRESRRRLRACGLVAW